MVRFLLLLAFVLPSVHAQESYPSKGIKIVVQNESLGFLDGSEIDFASEGLGRSFQFNNPNVTEECGCGESFTVG